MDIRLYSLLERRLYRGESSSPSAASWAIFSFSLLRFLDLEPDIHRPGVNKEPGVVSYNDSKQNNNKTSVTLGFFYIILSLQFDLGET